MQINFDAVEKDVKGRLFHNECSKEYSAGAMDALSIVKLHGYDIPTGYWESVGFVGMKYAWFRCSNCHKITKIYKDSSNDFCCIADIRKKAVACLYCGADMRGEENEEI